MTSRTDNNSNDASRNEQPGIQGLIRLSRWQGARDSLVLLILVAIAIFGGYLGLIDLWFIHPKPFEEAIKLQASIIATILCALSLVVGLELFYQFRRLDQHFRKDENFSQELLKHFQKDEEINQKINSSLKNNQEFLFSLLGGRLITHSTQIYSRLTELASQAENEIKVLLYGSEWPSLMDWSEQVSENLKEKQLAEIDFTYQIVFSMNIDLEEEDFFQRIEKRLEIYSNKGASNLLDLRFINDNEPIGLNLFIFDSIHVAIVFSTHGTGNVNSCIIFENNSDISSRLATWFDNTVFHRAIKYKDLPKSNLLKDPSV